MGQIPSVGGMDIFWNYTIKFARINFRSAIIFFLHPWKKLFSCFYCKGGHHCSSTADCVEISQMRGIMVFAVCSNLSVLIAFKPKKRF